MRKMGKEPPPKTLFVGQELEVSTVAASMAKIAKRTTHTVGESYSCTHRRYLISEVEHFKEERDLDAVSDMIQRTMVSSELNRLMHTTNQVILVTEDWNEELTAVALLQEWPRAVPNQQLGVTTFQPQINVLGFGCKDIDDRSTLCLDDLVQLSRGIVEYAATRAVEDIERIPTLGVTAFEPAVDLKSLLDYKPTIDADAINNDLAVLLSQLQIARRRPNERYAKRMTDAENMIANYCKKHVDHPLFQALAEANLANTFRSLAQQCGTDQNRGAGIAGILHNVMRSLRNGINDSGDILYPPTCATGNITIDYATPSDDKGGTTLRLEHNGSSCGSVTFAPSSLDDSTPKIEFNLQPLDGATSVAAGLMLRAILGLPESRGKRAIVEDKWYKHQVRKA